MDIESNLTITGEKLRLYQAIKDHDLENIKLLLNDGIININEPIITTGPYAGFTALHLACMEHHGSLVRLLLTDYKADPKVMAEDRTQPIHMACFRKYDESTFGIQVQDVRDLCWYKGNTNAEFGREIFSKYIKDEEWRPDFGEKISLLTYAVLYGKEGVVTCLARYNDNLKIKSSLTNKTLLMYALENNMYNAAVTIVNKVEDLEYLNLRDNDGIPTTHYFLHPKKYGNFRYVTQQLFDDINRDSVFKGMIDAGVDLNSLINDDPSTFLLNMAAYRSMGDLLRWLLPAYPSITQSRALYYATLAVEDPNKFIRLDQNNTEWEHKLELCKKEAIALILKDLINRLTFGFSVPKEEKELMDKLIATETDIKNMVHDYKTNFIEGKLRKTFIELCDRRMTMYDFIEQAYNDKKLKLLARDKTLLDAFGDITDLIDFTNYDYFREQIIPKVERLNERFELLDKLKKISHLREAIPLPYELILDIVEYINNKDLDIFINAFVCP